MQFGKLTTLKYDTTLEPPKWKCKCECGNITYVQSAKLNNGHTKSCGCSQKDNIKKKIENGISKDPYYEKWKYHLKKGNNPAFFNFETFKFWYKTTQIDKIKPTNKLRMQWNNCISKNQNGDFLNCESYYSWAYKQGYIDNIHYLHRKNKELPHSMTNTEFGFFYEKKFISISDCKKYNFIYNMNESNFYGYIKYKGKIKNTKKYCTFSEMLTEYRQIYKYLFKKNFKFT